MKKFIKDHILTLIGALVGALGGYLYYLYVGCQNGTCAITSNPINSTLYGVLMGGLLLNSIESILKKKENG